MRILFDQGTPVPLRRHLQEHVVETAYERGWSHLANGVLLAAAEAEGYELLNNHGPEPEVPANLAGRSLAIVVLLSTSWPRIRQRLEDIQRAVGAITPGDYVEVVI